MDDMHAQVTSGALHLVFLAICFAVPASMTVEPVEPNVRFERWVETKLEIKVRELPIHRAVAVSEDPKTGLGSGVGTTDGLGAGPDWGDGVDRKAKAPEPGESSRSEGGERVERTRPASQGQAMPGDAGDDPVTAEPDIGELTDGADGGGGLGRADEPDPLAGGGMGGAGSSGCGCRGPLKAPGLGGIGGIGSLGTSTDVRGVRNDRQGRVHRAVRGGIRTSH